MGRIRVGKAAISVFEVGKFMVHLSDILDLTEEWRAKLGELNEKFLYLPSNCIFIQVGSVSMIVDPNDFLASCPPGTKGYPENCNLPPDIITQLRQNSIAVSDINQVVITHAHFDHYAAVTTRVGGLYKPTFPSSTYYLGLADWQSKEVQDGLYVENSGANITLRILKEAGLLKLVDSNIDINPEIKIMPFPGESPGHQIVRIHSDGETAYCIGDLFHHPIEIQNPTLVPPWTSSVKENLQSRKRFLSMALPENALLFPGHMSPGRLEKGSSEAIYWREM